MGPVALRAKLLESFDEKDWAAAHLADDKVLRALHFVAERDARAPAVESQPTAPPPPSEQKVLIRPPPSPARGLVTIREERKVYRTRSDDVRPGARAEVKGAQDNDSRFRRLRRAWVRLPSRRARFRARAPARPLVCRGGASAWLWLMRRIGRGVRRRRHRCRGRCRPAEPRRRLDRRRHKWRGGADPGGSFSIRAVVLPAAPRGVGRTTAASSCRCTSGSSYKRDDNTPCLESEVSERIGLVNESVETRADRRRGAARSAARNAPPSQERRQAPEQRELAPLRAAPAAAEAPAPAPVPGRPLPPSARARYQRRRSPAGRLRGRRRRLHSRASKARGSGRRQHGLSYFNFEKVLDGDADQESSAKRAVPCRQELCEDERVPASLRPDR